jgi:hypothetical protein
VCVDRSGDMLGNDAATGADCIGYEERRSMFTDCSGCKVTPPIRAVTKSRQRRGGA